MELLEAGSLADFVSASGPLDESVISFILRELLIALQYLHGQGKVHRDVKGGNILVASDGQCKLADFGVATELNETMNKKTTRIGSPHWMAPEVIMQASYDGCADIWSTGITAIELAKGTPPYADSFSHIQVVYMIPHNPAPILEGDQFSLEFKDFVKQCLNKSAQDRPTAAALLTHPFLLKAEKTSSWTSAVAKHVLRKVTQPRFVFRILRLF